jgi:hypothetical protein
MTTLRRSLSAPALWAEAALATAVLSVAGFGLFSGTPIAYRNRPP